MVTAAVDTQGKPSRRAALFSASYESAAVWYAACVLLPLAYYLTFYRYGIDLDDEGFFIGGASAILHSGQLPIADFMSYPPWMYFSLAGFFHLFGETLLVERALLIVHLLIGIVCLLWLSRKVLPPRIALIPVFFYAVAPGPWYRVFFVFSIIIVTVALVYFNDRPSLRRALLVGLATGFAVITRWQAAAVSVAVFIGALGVLALCDLRTRRRVGAVALRHLGNCATYLVGFATAPAIAAIPYAATGKLDALIVNWARYQTPAATANSSIGQGLQDMFRPWTLFSHPRIEQWVYAIAMAACIAFILVNAAMLLRSEPEHPVRLRRKILLGAMAIASMGETFFFVWNSRMLSTFAIVTLAVVTLLYDATRPLASRPRTAAFAAGCAAIVATIFSFSKTVDYYSGSIAVFRRDIQYRQTIVPFLKGAMIWLPQADTIDQLYRIAQKHRNATLVPMTYTTMLAYLSSLRNPTYYRLFVVAEMLGKKGQEVAIRTFEQDRIAYFVARRGTFFSNDDPGARQLEAFPLVKNYLLSHYNIRPLGANYVILIRRGAS